MKRRGERDGGLPPNGADIVPFPTERREPLERVNKIDGGGMLLILPVIKVERTSSDD